MITTPASSRTARYGGRLVHVSQTDGTDPVVVLLGGCGVPSFLWDDVIAGLDGRATLALDRPGLGGTPWPGRIPTLADELSTLADLVDDLDRPVVVVGHSMGGPHAEAYARLHPERVVGLVLIDSSVDWDPRPPRDASSWLRAARLARRAATLPPVARLGSFAQRALIVAQSHLRMVDRADPRAVSTFRDPDAIASVVAEQAADPEQLWDLSQLRGGTDTPRNPTRVLVGGRGSGRRWVPCQRRLAELLGGQLVELPAARHMIMLDDPAAVCAAIADVIAEADRA